MIKPDDGKITLTEFDGYTRKDLFSEIESLRQQLAEANEHIEYLLSRDKAWADIDSLKEQQLVDSQKQVTLLRAALRHLWNERTPDSYDEAGEALAATADLDGVILCDAEPVAWQTFDGEGGYDYRSYEDNEDYRDDYIKRNSSQKFYENWVIPLYRAWKPSTHNETTSPLYPSKVLR